MTNQLLRARFVALVCAIGASTALAAPAPNVTPGVARQSVQQPRAQLTDRGIQVPSLSGSAVHQPVPPGGTPIPVSRFEFTGNTMVPTATLQSQVADKIGKQLTLAELYAVAASLTRFYQGQGYPLASVNVPVQHIVGGVVKLEVTEGRIGEVRVEGQHYYKNEALKAQLSELASGSVVTTAQLERELLLLNDLPGITARVTILPGAQPGTSDLVVRIEEDAFSFYTSVDNYGRSDIGDTRFSFNSSINGMGRGDAITLNLTHSEANLLNYARLAYGTPVGTDGARFELSYYVNDYRTNTFPLVQPGGQSYGLRGELSYPVVRSRAENRVLAVAYGGTSTETTAGGAVVAESSIELLEVGYFGNNVYGDRKAFTFSMGFSGNLRFNDGTNDGDQCCKLAAEGSWMNPVGETWYSRVRLRGAWAPDVLADIEKVSLGGPYSVRGYESSEIRGDMGYDGSLELHRPMKIFKGRGEALIFADFGQVASRDGFGTLDPSVDLEYGEATDGPVLGAVGFGFTAFDVYGFECNLQFAMPMGGYAPSDGKDDGRVFFSIGGRF